MPFHLSIPKLLIILVIVVFSFGTRRGGKLAGELGRGIRSFRDGIKPDEQESQPDK